MDHAQFEHMIFRALLQVQGLPLPPTVRGLAPPEPGECSESQEEIRTLAKRLIAEAYQNGLEGTRDYELESEKLSGGAVTEYVWRVSSTLPFVFKASRNPDLASQAATLRDLRNSDTLPPDCRELFPRVYSSCVDATPFAYIMEFFGDNYTNLRDHLFATCAQAQPDEVVERVVHALFDLFRKTIRRNLIPNVTEIYTERIRERLDGAKGENSKFKALTESPVVICGERYGPYVDYVTRLEARIRELTPPFCTFVHGDPHPGNIFFKADASGLAVRLIDPKSWIWGDYLFDVGKLLHYVMVTGPLEDLQRVQVEIQEGIQTRVTYQIVPPDAAVKVITSTRASLNDFAHTHRDVNFEPRLILSLATNFLGLCQNRLQRRPPLYKNAVVFYCEGLRHLNMLTQQLSP